MLPSPDLMTLPMEDDDDASFSDKKVGVKDDDGGEFNRNTNAELNMHNMTILRLTPSNIDVAHCTTLVSPLEKGLP